MTIGISSQRDPASPRDRFTPRLSGGVASFPFPSMASPLPPSPATHYPFTALSPTSTPKLTSGLPTSRLQQSRSAYEETRDSFRSGSVTPASTITFAPQASVTPRQNSEFPNPNLYDASLLLYSEPGLDPWWSNVVHLLRDAYKAERVTLAVPADSTDLENVPWGQKATFDGSLLEETQREDDLTASFRLSGHGEKPDIEQHSPKDRRSSEDEHTILAPGVSRLDSTDTITDTASTSRPDMERRETYPDMAAYFSRNSNGRVFERLVPLQDELDPLLDNAGVLRVLERSKPVLISREYLTKADDQPQQGRETVPEVQPDLHSATKPFLKRNQGKRYQSWSNREAPHTGTLLAPTAEIEYEDFEQPLSSPWAQSPAPSPAIRSDPNENPFFANIHEASFEPSASPVDYSNVEPVAAIGVERTMTIVHIPLVRPLAPSLVLRDERLRSENAAVSLTSEAAGSMFDVRRPSTVNKHGRPPIAILSFLTAVVPYPSNLVYSLSCLAPHLASSFSISRQYSQVESDAIAVSHRQRNSYPERMMSESVAPGTFDELSGLDTLRRTSTYDESLQAGPGSASVTSPSDYSAMSKSSPAGSRIGTPAWDPGFVGLANSSANTPAHAFNAETIDSYFSAKRAPLNRAHTSTGHPAKNLSYSGRPRTLSAQSAAAQKAPTSDPGNAQGPVHALKPDERESIEEAFATAERQARRDDSMEAESSEQSGSSSSSKRSSRHHPVVVTTKPHSLLHSYGADFATTFQSLPSTTSLPRFPASQKLLGRPAAAVGLFEMPPPSERLLRTIIDAIPVQVFTAAPQTGDITWVNSRSLMYRGQTVSEFLADPWQSIHPEERDKFLTMWGQALKQGEQFSHQVRIRRFDGMYRWFYVRAAPLRDVRGVAVHWFGTNMDIHEQHIAEVNAARQEETAASEAKYRALANSSPQIVFACTEKDGMIFANVQWMRYSGQTMAEALGIGFVECVHPEDISKCRLPADVDLLNLPPTPAVPSRNPSEFSVSSSDLSSDETPASEQTIIPKMNIVNPPTNSNATVGDLKSLTNSTLGKVSRDPEGRVSYSTEVRLRNKAGEYRWHLVRVLSVDAINFGNGEGSWFGTCTDINDHKLLEQKLKETMDSKTRFLSNMSHEIRTPLIGISGMVNFLLDTPLTGEQLDYCSTISSSSEGLLQVINDILDLSKVEAGMMRLARDWFHVRSLIEDTNELLSAMAIQKRLELNYIVGDDVPAIVNGDRVRMRQVLLNIIGNAIKFTKEGEVFSRCSIVHDASSNDGEVMLRFEVDDTGPGFTKADAELMFKPFSQIDGSSTRQHGGSGLGLVISRQLVELHGGMMHGSSVPGQGSTFVFTAKFGVPTEKTPLPTQKVKAVSSPAANSRRSTEATIPLLAKVLSQSPAPSGEDSPALTLTSSGSSELSAKSYRSFPSPRSSTSSYMAPLLITPLDTATMKLSLPEEARIKVAHSAAVDSGSMSDSPSTSSMRSNDNLPPSSMQASISQHNTAGSPPQQFRPPMFSILVLCPQKYSREAITSHIKATLPNQVPYQITSISTVEECQALIGGDTPVVFTHLVISIIETENITALIDHLLGSASPTSIVILSDPIQRNEIMQTAPQYDYDKLQKTKRLHFLYKPVKPSKFQSVFDQDQHGAPLEKQLSVAEHTAQTQRDAFVDMEKEVGNKGHRVLLVEDNPLNRKVMLRFLQKIGLDIETALDGAECTEKMFARGPSYYSVVLCDLHMPRKDGYHTCREVRAWETDHSFPRTPFIALSANVMDDAVDNAMAAGFDRFFSKPVDFLQLSQAMNELVGPAKQPA